MGTHEARVKHDASRLIAGIVLAPSQNRDTKHDHLAIHSVQEGWTAAMVCSEARQFQANTSGAQVLNHKLANKHKRTSTQNE